MNLLNRVLVTLSAFLLLILAVAAIYSVWSAPRDLSAFLRGVALFTSGNLGPTRIAITAVGGVIVLICLLILLAEFSTETKEDVQITNVKGGTAKVSIQTISDRIKREAERLEHIHSVEPHVTSRGSSADIHVRVRAYEGNYPEEASYFFHLIKNAVERDMGVKIRKLDANFTSYPGPRASSTETYRQEPGQRDVIIVPDAETQHSTDAGISAAPEHETPAVAEKQEIFVPPSLSGRLQLEDGQEEGKRKEEGA